MSQSDCSVLQTGVQAPGLDVLLRSHECFRILEIQRRIFSMCRPADGAQLARTCRLFYKVAMDIVWRVLPSLLPLIWCMPSEALHHRTPETVVTGGSVEEPPSQPDGVEIIFNRTLTRNDWTLFSKHTHRVRSLHLHHDQVFHGRLLSYYPAHVTYALTRETMTSLVALIQRYTSTEGPGECSYLFSRLSCLTVTPGFNFFIPNYVQVLCGESLQTLALVRDTTNYMTDAALCVAIKLPDILSTLGSIWPNLWRIDIDDLICRIGEVNDVCFVDKLRDWLFHLTKLRWIEIELRLHSPIFKILSELPHLQNLRVVGSPDAPHSTNIECLSSRSFASIKHLLMTFHDADSLAQLLRPLASSATLLSLIGIRCVHRCPRQDTGSCHCAAAILQPISHIPSLETLMMRLIAPDTESVANTKPSLSGVPFSYLFSLRHLKHAVLMGFSCHALTDDDLRGAAVAWPELESIQLNDEPGDPRATLAGVQAFYNYCPKLEKLSLPANDSIPANGDGILDIPAARTRSAAVENLEVVFCAHGGLKDGSDEYIPMLVRLMFPELKRFEARASASQPAMDDWSTTVSENWNKYRRMEAHNILTMLQPWGLKYCLAHPVEGNEESWDAPESPGVVLSKVTMQDD